MSETTVSFSAIVKEGAARATDDFTCRIERFGFKRARKMFWVRVKPFTVEFIHLHRCGSSYGAPTNASVWFRIHCGIRVLNDCFEAAALNGPDSESNRGANPPYHLRFNAETGSTYDRCIDDLERFICEQGEPWFKSFSKPESLIRQSNTPLKDHSKNLLQEALNGHPNAKHVALSLKLLGLKSSDVVIAGNQSGAQA